MFFAVGFAEFVGVPILSLPVLIGGGAMVASGTLGFGGVVVSVAAGGCLADLVWYSIGRRHGSWLIGLACGLPSNPMACVSTVKNRLSRLGTPYILIARMLPGTGNLIAVAAGQAGFGTLPFILADGAPLILWAAIYTGTGWIFSDHVTAAIEWALRYNRVVVVLLLLIVLATAWRLWKAARLSRAPPARGRPPRRGEPAPFRGVGVFVQLAVARTVSASR